MMRRWGWPVLMLVGYVACSEVLARMHRSLLDPGGRIDLLLAALTLFTLGLRLVVVFGLPPYVLASVVTSVRERALTPPCAGESRSAHPRPSGSRG